MDVKICEGRDESAVEIDDRAFQYCEKLESAVIGGDEVRIGEYAFLGMCGESFCYHTGKGIQGGKS